MKQISLMATAWMFVSLFVFSGTAWSQHKDPLDGTWTLNAAKSKFTAGPKIKSQTRKYEVSADEVKQTLDGVDENGKSSHSTFTAHYDGKDYPVSGNPDADTISVKRTGSHSAKSVMKKDGKPAFTVMRSVSKDGKTLTMKSTGTNAKGEKIDEVLVFDRQ
jgi:hypothetical protein